jgi:2-isopropylmalate synthase
LIFDTTLRDGQQCPGAAISIEDNLTYASLAHEVAVDILEAGFPAASNVEYEIVKQIVALFEN